MITKFRRFLLLVSLFLWQGGLMFYGGVIVPVGATVLGSDTDQGFITQPVSFASFSGWNSSGASENPAC